MADDPVRLMLKRAAVGAALALLHPKDADRAAAVVEGDLLERGAAWLRGATGIDIEIERKDSDDDTGMG